MKANITIETVCNAISVHWATALESESSGDWCYRWGAVERTLSGIWLTANYCVDDRSAGLDELLDDISTLKSIAFERSIDISDDLPAFLRRQAD